MAELEDDRDPEVVIATEVDDAGDPIVVLAGEVDMSNVGSLSEVVAPITATQPARLTFDFTRLRFIDSAGIAVLVTAANATTVSVRNPSAIVRSAIEATGLSSVLHLAGDS